MDLTAGTRLGPYEIATLVGSGGMGVVYRARDTRLGRDVALKVLPSGTTHDEERLRRFELEARAAGGLSHPNILTIYDVGRHEGAPYVVAEMLEGETLRARLAQGPLPLHRALDVATQVARGLAAAHERGVVHRDIKPDNVFLTRDGVVKVLDFGLAKLTNGDLALHNDVTAELTLTRTAPGSVLGTAGYMSPEQVRGLAVDSRSDIFSFGALLYEMVTGQRAFERDHAIDTLNAILHDEPPVSSPSGRALPPGIERLLRHCLEKRPEDRFQSARDLVFDLETLSGLNALGSDALAARATRTIRPHDVRVTAAAALVVLGTVTGFWMGRDGTVPAMPSYRQITFRHGQLAAARFAPDGGTFVYSAAWDDLPPDTFVGRFDGPDARALDLPGTTLQAVTRTGEMAVIHRHDDSPTTLARVPLAGGPLRDILAGAEWADWSADGTRFAAVIATPDRMRIEFPVGHTLAETTGALSHPRLSRDGRLVAFLEHPIRHDDRGLVAVVDLEGRKRVLSDGWASTEGLAWSPDGREVWFSAARQGSQCGLHAVDLRGRVRTLDSAPGRLVLHDVAPDGRVLVSHNLTRSEMYVLSPGTRTPKSLDWYDYSFAVDLSSDGRVVLFAEGGEAGGAAYGVYYRGTDGSPAVRLGEGRAKAFSPDGAWALTLPFDAPERIVLLPMGAGQPRTLPLAPLINCDYATWFPDGRSLLVLASQPGRPSRLWQLPLDGSAPARPLTPEGVIAHSPSVRPDGRALLAYDTRRTPAEPGLYAVDGQGGAGRPVTILRGDEDILRWSADGQALFVASGQRPLRRIFRIEWPGGQRRLLHEIQSNDPVGIYGASPVYVSADGNVFSYNVRRTRSTLFLAQGLR